MSGNSRGVIKYVLRYLVWSLLILLGKDWHFLGVLSLTKGLNCHVCVNWVLKKRTFETVFVFRLAYTIHIVQE